MIRAIIDLLNANDFYDVAANDVKFAKGAYNFPTSWDKFRD